MAWAPWEHFIQTWSVWQTVTLWARREERFVSQVKELIFVQTSFTSPLVRGFPRSVSSFQHQKWGWDCEPRRLRGSRGRTHMGRGLPALTGTQERIEI